MLNLGTVLKLLNMFNFRVRHYCYCNIGKIEGKLKMSAYFAWDLIGI